MGVAPRWKPIWPFSAARTPGEPARHRPRARDHGRVDRRMRPPYVCISTLDAHARGLADASSLGRAFNNLERGPLADRSILSPRELVGDDHLHGVVAGLELRDAKAPAHHDARHVRDVARRLRPFGTH